ncbi:hypothetical protein ACSETL_31765 [Pseudomonas aeruginosa]
MTTDKGPSFLSIFPILAKLLFSYGKRLLSVDTLVSLEKKTGAGSGERTPEEIALDQALERNPHQLQINMEPGHKPTPSIAQLLEQSAGDRLVVNEEAIRAARNLRIPRSSGHPFHKHLTTDSTVIRPPIPRVSDH